MTSTYGLNPGAVRPPAESCWLCGIRLPVPQLMADGGSACLDLRWYCRDMQGCTERWTARWERSRRHGQGTSQPLQAGI
jgi:hypothetical protein